MSAATLYDEPVAVKQMQARSYTYYGRQQMRSQAALALTMALLTVAIPTVALPTVTGEAAHALPPLRPYLLWQVKQLTRCHYYGLTYRDR